jgi:hypothetical protein
MNQRDEQVRRIQEALAAPFPADAIGWKPQSISQGRCLAVAYIDARDVQNRLDDVLGVDGWESSLEVLLDGNVLFRLRARIAGEWITRCDVGAQSDQDDEGDRRKAAVSDGLKRAAVQLGIGRYLYSLPAQWVDYDAQRKQIVGTPRLPHWAIPAAPGLPGGRGGVSPPTDKEKQANGKPQPMANRITAADMAAVKEGLCKSGELEDAVERALAPKHGNDPDAWPEAAVAELLKEWFADQRSRLPATAEQTKAVDAELARVGRKWTDCQRKLKLRKDVGLTDITRGQAAELLGYLKDMPAAAG